MENYSEMKFKCGVEIHQQIESSKLFCPCPSLVNDPAAPDIHFTRRLRASAGESGSTDQAALFEMQRARLIEYEGCSSSCCLVELDEEPPHAVNKDALRLALEVALVVNATPVPVIQFMRKTVIDGSNVSGFQRTALIATNGTVKTSKGPVSIPTICVEEESAKKLHAEEKRVKYRLDRLGVPLIEIATAPDIKDPEHCKEVAALLGMILRSTGKVKRGIGTIRQDVNVSILNKPRIELKGFQDLRSIPRIIENEIHRLQALKEWKAEVRRVNPDGSSSFLRPMPGASRMYPETDIPLIATHDLLKNLQRPVLLTEKAELWEKKYKLSPELAREAIEHPFFESFVARYPQLEPKYVAQVLIEMPKEIASRFKVNASVLKEADFSLVLDPVAQGKIPKSAVLDMLTELSRGKPVIIDQYAQLNDATLEREIQAILAKNPNASMNALMGEVMKKFRGKVDGKKVSELLQRLLKK